MTNKFGYGILFCNILKETIPRRIWIAKIGKLFLFLEICAEIKADVN